MVLNYETASAEELLFALGHAGRAPDLDLIRACLAKREEITPELLAMLGGGVDESWDEDDPRWYQEIHAGLLLIAFREPAALPIFACLLADEDREDLFEWFGQELPVYGPAIVGVALQVLSVRSGPEYGRTVASEILAAVGWHYPETREHIIAGLCALLPPLDEQGRLVLSRRDRRWPDPLWAWIAMALSDLRDTASRPQIMALFKARLMDETIMGGLKDYLAALEPDAPPLLAASHKPGDILGLYENLVHEAERERERQLKAEEETMREEVPADEIFPGGLEPDDWDEEAALPTRAQPKVGRNDPCPCGSGRKYKHCCGKRQSAPSP